MNKAFQYGEGHDEVWIVETDKMKNYKNYFEADNSCNLSDKFSIEKRLGFGDELEDFWNDFRSKHTMTIDTRSGERQTKKTLKTSFKTLKTMGVKFSSDKGSHNNNQ